MAVATKTRLMAAERNGDDTKAAGEVIERITITPPKMETIKFLIVGTSPYVQNRFGQKAIDMMTEKMQAGSQAKKGKQREAKDFQACYEQAKHVSSEGWLGIPAPAFRNGMIAACRLCGFEMTICKRTVFVFADGFDKVDGTPLVKITKGEARYSALPVRNATGVADIRPRPMWDPGWQAELRVEYDADIFSKSDIANLLTRVGIQEGIGEGRPGSKKSNGLGWGLFRIE